jgi:RNase P subunit RPR2
MPAHKKPIPIEKVCKRCHRLLPASQFFFNARGKGEPKTHLSSACKDCEKIRWMKRMSNPSEAEHIRSTHRQYYRNRKESDSDFMAKQREKKRVWWMDRFYDAIKAYGGKCRDCGESRFEALMLHHTNGNGGQHRKELSKHNIGSSVFYYYLGKMGYPPGLEVLCGTCHLILHRMEKKRWQQREELNQ